MVKKHGSSQREAHLVESKLRVLFIWAQKEKHGTAKPLPCEECSCWFSRLDIHLKGYHNYDHGKAKTTVTDTRKKYWCDITGEVKESVETSNSSTVNYVPVNSKSITMRQKKEWGIENYDFHITYENGDDLLDAFHEEISCKKSNDQYATNYRNHVEYIWTVVDPDKVVLPACVLDNPVLVEDNYRRTTYS